MGGLCFGPIGDYVYLILWVIYYTHNCDLYCYDKVVLKFNIFFHIKGHPNKSLWLLFRRSAYTLVHIHTHIAFTRTCVFEDKIIQSKSNQCNFLQPSLVALQLVSFSSFGSGTFCFLSSLLLIDHTHSYLNQQIDHHVLNCLRD